MFGVFTDTQFLDLNKAIEQCSPSRNIYDRRVHRNSITESQCELEIDAAINECISAGVNHWFCFSGIGDFHQNGFYEFSFVVFNQFLGNFFTFLAWLCTRWIRTCFFSLTRSFTISLTKIISGNLANIFFIVGLGSRFLLRIDFLWWFWQSFQQFFSISSINAERSSIFWAFASSSWSFVLNFFRDYLNSTRTITIAIDFVLC